MSGSNWKNYYIFNNSISLIDLLEYSNKIDVILFSNALLIQRKVFTNFNIDLIKDIFTTSFVADQLLACFTDNYLEYNISRSPAVHILDKTITINN